MIYDNDVAVKYIIDFVKKYKAKNKLSDKNPIREDIFELIDNESILLYYCLDDEKIKGCHIKKVMNGELRHFVFINTNKRIQEQTWTAAHELGHVCEVDKIVNNQLGSNKIDPEDIVNRFAAELLFQEEIFRNETKKLLGMLRVDNGAMSKSKFMYLVTHMMDYFCAPYKAVIRRFVELGYIERKNEIQYINAFKNNEWYYEQLLRENFFTHLNNRRDSYKMEDIGEDINELEEKRLLSDKKIEKYRELFKLKKKDESEETFEIGGHNGRKQSEGLD